jgi:pyruvate dehydrogenase E2 component (dihydrolipoamide acetyltransferase)
MRHEFRLADIGEGLEEAEIIAWMVQVGDQVKRDQPLIEVMTDKSNAELPAPAAGTIVELAGAVGDIITVGGLIAIIDEATAQPDAAHPPTIHPDTVQPATARPAPHDLQQAAAVSPASSTVVRPKASPSTRREAAARGIELSEIVGSGPGGRILLSDLDNPTGSAPSAEIPALKIRALEIPAVEAPSAQATPGQNAPVQDVALRPAEPGVQRDRARPPGDLQGTVPLRGVRRAVAKNMAQSWSEIPHIHAFAQVDAEPLLELRARLRDTDRAAFQALTPLTFFVAAVARALRANPEANASIDMADETITYHPQVNVGVAVAADKGLVVPVLRRTDELDFETLSLTLSQLVRGAREGSLSREHFRGGTVTITNFGSLGGEQAAPLIRPPESLIVGFGSIAERPFVVDSQVVARKTMHIVVGADHRLLDGDVTTSVLTEIGDALSDPLRLIL